MVKKYEVKFGKLVQLWCDYVVIVKATSKEEAIKKALNDEYSDIIYNEYKPSTEKQLKTVFEPENGDYIEEVR